LAPVEHQEQGGRVGGDVGVDPTLIGRVDLEASVLEAEDVGRLAPEPDLVGGGQPARSVRVDPAGDDGGQTLEDERDVVGVDRPGLVQGLGDAVPGPASGYRCP
jgi:hypothetical protein